ncbi:MAG: hypothetical protein ACOVK6_06340, partial [Ramlibacter sp.]
LDVMFRRLAADWQQLRYGASAETPRTRPTAAAAARSAGAVDLLTALQQSRGQLNAQDSVRLQKLRSLRCAAWGRGLTFGLSLLAIATSGAVVTVNPVIGGVMIVMSVYAARQAYADWRLARENLAEFRADRPVSPLGSNALAQALYQVYTDDPQRALPPSEAQVRATHRAAAVSVVSVAASVAVGGAAMALGVAAPVVVSGLRHAARFIGSGAAPVAEVASRYAAEARVARLAQHTNFDSTCRTSWETFFASNSVALDRCRQAYAAYAGDSPAAAASHADADADADRRLHAALARWTRDTRRLEDLQAWMALDTAAPQEGLTWAQRLFADLAAIEAARTRSRVMTVWVASTNTATGIVSLAL